MGTVYLVRDMDKPNAYKIGVTRGSVENRIKKLQTGNSGEIVLVSSFPTEYPFDLEKMLHFEYRENNILNEWFDMNDADVKKFIETCHKLHNRLNSIKNTDYFRKKHGLSTDTAPPDDIF